jgi:hypothetical protein
MLIDAGMRLGMDDLRMLSTPKGMCESKDDTNHGNQGSNLDHSPCRPVERNKILAVTKLKSKNGIRFHDDDDGGNRDTSKTHINRLPYTLRSSFRIMSKLFTSCLCTIIVR